jgi:hypothetical protein
MIRAQLVGLAVNKLEKEIEKEIEKAKAKAKAKAKEKLETKNDASSSEQSNKMDEKRKMNENSDILREDHNEIDDKSLFKSENKSSDNNNKMKR